MSQPCDLNCDVAQPGPVDAELNEFWEGNPWEIFQRHNLSCFERNRMFLNVPGKDRRNFVDISFVSGTDSDGDGRACVPVDYNHDGRLDLVVRQAGGGPMILYENRLPQGNYLKVTLRGRTSNRLGIGSRLTAKVGDGQLVRECYPFNTYRSQTPLTVHFGLGQASHVDELIIQWPSGEDQKIKGLSANRHYVITEGDDEVFTTQPGVVIAP